MLRIHVLPRELKGRTCVLIDVLRATSTIVTALASGANSVKPVLTVEDALKLKGYGYIVAGERGGIKPPDFDLGNSPLEFRKHDLAGKRIALTTTNGTRALSMMECDVIYAASFLNLSSVSRLISDLDDVDVVCSGTEGEFSLEDFLLAGFLAKSYPGEMNDAAEVSAVYASGVSNVEIEMKRSSHAKRLIDLGFEEDVAFCSRTDLYDIVPVFENGEFRVYNQAFGGGMA